MSSSYCAADFSLRDDWKQREVQLHTFKVLSRVRNTDFVQAVALVAGYARRHQILKHSSHNEPLPRLNCNRADILKLSKNDYTRWVDPVMKGFQSAARFLHSQKIFVSQDISYPIQLVALSAILTIMQEFHQDSCTSEPTRSKLRRWFWSGLFSEQYTGWGEAKASRDALEVPLWLTQNTLPSTVKNAHITVERLQRVRKRYGAVYRGFSILLRHQGAIDFNTGEAINDVLFFQEQIDSHHIFPVAWCRQQGIDPSKYNSIVNRTLLSAKTNKKIGAKAPSDYLALFESAGTSPASLDRMLESHLIDPYTLRRNDFEGFYQARLRALLELIGNAMGKPLTPYLPSTYHPEVNPDRVVSLRSTRPLHYQTL